MSSATSSALNSVTAGVNGEDGGDLRCHLEVRAQSN
jgi:hypothetical protein